MGKRNRHDKEFDIDDLFGNFIINSEKKEEHIPWKNCFYKIWFSFKRLFCSPKPRKDLNLLEQVENLLNSVPTEQPSSDIIDKCLQFIRLHRITENTSARRRLEKWATRVIMVYLIIVLILVIINSIKSHLIVISDTVMITILSTTTVNIIGLGLIVLRGHFYLKDEDFNHSLESHKENHEN